MATGRYRGGFKPPCTVIPIYTSVINSYINPNFDKSEKIMEGVAPSLQSGRPLGQHEKNHWCGIKRRSLRKRNISRRLCVHTCSLSCISDSVCRKTPSSLIQARFDISTVTPPLVLLMRLIPFQYMNIAVVCIIGVFTAVVSVAQEYVR